MLPDDRDFGASHARLAQRSAPSWMSVLRPQAETAAARRAGYSNRGHAANSFMVSQLIEAVGLAFAITSVIAFAVANITPTLAAAIATTIQIARWLGSEIGSAVIQTFVRVRELYLQIVVLNEN
jgi:hypothetical protein